MKLQNSSYIVDGYVRISNIWNTFCIYQRGLSVVIFFTLGLEYFNFVLLLKVSIAFNKLVETVDRRYICLDVNELSSNVSIMEYEMDVSAKLGSVHLTDYLFQGKFFLLLYFMYK